MKWRKIMDGVYEGESFKPEPIGPVTFHSEFSDDDFSRKLLKKAAKGITVQSHYHYDFPAKNAYYLTGPNNEPKWHIDGGEYYNCDNYTYLLLLIATDDPTLGTEVGNLSDGSVFRGKTWTPYLVHGRVLHRSPPDGSRAGRKLYRFYVNVDKEKAGLPA